MKILFLITNENQGVGGHYHSLNQISKKIAEKHQVKIVSIGPGYSNIIESNPYFMKNIYFNGFNIYSLNKELKIIISTFKPDIYHCFDHSAYNIIRLKVSTIKNKIVINKCGGPNPHSFSHALNLILFSYENYLWFQSQVKYNSSNVYLIPNRVNKIEKLNVIQPFNKLKNRFHFIRICRICSVYEKSIVDSINLIEKLLSVNVNNIMLYIIGTIEEVNVFNKYIIHPLVKSGYVIFITKSKYTSNASKMLYLADAVIGTGRGLMESASLSIPLLTINSEGDIPVLLNSENFNDALMTNFSERNFFVMHKNQENFEEIIKLINNQDFYLKMSEFSKKMFDRYFNIKFIACEYSKVYINAKYGKRHIIDDFEHILRSFKNFFLYSLKFKKINI